MRNSTVDIVILETFAKEQSHLTSHDVYEQIRQRLPAVNPSTVYRALERLANNGKVSVSDLGTGPVVYEALTDGVHHHLVCQKCGQVFTIEHEEVSEFFSKIGKKNKFQVATNHLILFGLCESCQDSNDP